MSLKPGTPAPDFTLYSDEKKAFTLSDHQGDKNVVLLFFPGAFTSVCTDELNEVNNDLDAYGSDTEVVGISTDSPFALAEFKKVHGFDILLLSDHDAEVSAAYGAKYDGDFTPMKLSRIAKRSAFVVGKDGTLRYAEVLDNAGQMPDLAAVKQAVSAD